MFVTHKIITLINLKVQKITLLPKQQESDKKCTLKNFVKKET